MSTTQAVVGILGFGVVAFLPIGSALCQSTDFTYRPPGVAETNAAGPGRVGDRTIYARDIGFPLEVGSNEKIVLNSQVYRPGGSHPPQGSVGGQCAAMNYAMPWHDNYCEKRSWNMPLCPGSKGHQGVDIRPAMCRDLASRAVAVEDGTVLDTDADVSMVKIRGVSGITYRYLHLDPNSFEVGPGDAVKRGSPLGRVSNLMNGAHQTTWHLHFDMQMRVPVGSGAAIVFVPPYASLVAAYRRMVGLPALDNNGILGQDPAREIDN